MNIFQNFNVFLVIRKTVKFRTEPTLVTYCCEYSDPGIHVTHYF